MTQTERLTVALAGQYRIERHLGEGGMATVYLAHDIKHDRKVAVKVLRPELAAVLGAERFVQEIKTTAALQHPHILPLFDSGRAETAGDDGRAFLYYVMPYVEGETLRDKLKRDTQLGIDEAVRITCDVADALDYAHRHGVIHRDIKPENILLHDGRPVVADFGIALAVSAAAGGRMTETGLSLGTPFYMSPEQATADKDLTARSDIYSLGCVLFEMLAGEPPHTGASAQAIVMKIVTDNARPVTDLRKTVPPHVALATAKALEKLPADRFESAHDFGAALKNSGFTTQHGTAQTAAKGSAVAAKRTALTPVLAAAVIAFAVLAAWGWTRSTAENRLAMRARIPIPLENGLGNDFGSQIALAPDGTRLVFASAVDGTPRLWMLERNQLEPKLIPGTDQAHQPFFSPDGTKIAFVTWDRHLKVVSLSGEPPTTLADTGIVRGGGAWGEDGFIYLSGGSRETGLSYRGLVRIPATGGQIEEVSKLDTVAKEIVHNMPAVLPGSRGIIFTLQKDIQYDPQRSEIAVVDLKTHKHRTLLQGIAARWSPTGHLIVVRADGALVAAPFDPKTLELTGPATPLLEGVEVEVLASSDIALSTTGTLIYASGGGVVQRFDPIIVDRAGHATNIDSTWQGRFRFPVLSPDGKQLAVTIVGGESQVWIKHLPNGPFSKLTFEGRTNQRADWLPDGRTVAYVSDAKGKASVFVKRADGSDAAQLAMTNPAVINEVEWSHDGVWAVARINGSPHSDIIAWQPGRDTVSKPLIATNFDELEPALSPDSKWIAYVSNETGRYEVYVRPFPNATSAKWQVSTAGGTEPLWAHSGHELFYRDAQLRLTVVQLEPGPTFATGAQKPLFSMAGGSGGGESHRTYDVAADDQHFVMIRSLATTTAVDTPLIVVDNFFAELREKVKKK